MIYHTPHTVISQESTTKECRFKHRELLLGIIERKNIAYIFLFHFFITINMVKIVNQSAFIDIDALRIKILYMKRLCLSCYEKIQNNFSKKKEQKLFDSAVSNRYIR